LKTAKAWLRLGASIAQTASRRQERPGTVIAEHGKPALRTIIEQSDCWNGRITLRRQSITPGMVDAIRAA